MLSKTIETFRGEAKRQEVQIGDERFFLETPNIGLRKQPAPIDIVLLGQDADAVSSSKSVYNGTSSRVRYPEGMTDFHRREFIELVYIFEGTYHFFTETEELIFEAKELCLVDPELLYRESTQREAYTAVFVCMSRSFFDSMFLTQLDEQKTLASFVWNALYHAKNGKGYLHLDTNGETEEIEDCLESIAEEIRTHKSGYSFICKGYMLRLFEMLTPKLYPVLQTKDQQAFQQQLYETVLSYMSEHVGTVTLTELSEEFHFQKDYFNRLLKKHTGQSFREVRQRLRMKRAAYLLRHTSLPVAELAEQTGYQSATHFYEAFTKEYHMTPAAYRESAQKSN
ncbi:MAG: helix-turn-helix transcriptional regulator [Lachnospiraceae bacterium]|nr:helix-turn-helix transcriptional regulator [Lachnospiraceae bacterium]